MRRWYLFVAALFVAASANADFGQYRGYKLDGPTLVVVSDLGQLQITPVDDAAFEVHYIENGVKQLPSFAMDPNDKTVLQPAVSESGAALTFVIDGLTAIVDKSPLKVRFIKDGEPLVAEEHGYFAYETVRGFRFRLDDDEKILGGGQRVMGMDRRGQRMPLYNKASYGYETEAKQMYYSLPAVMSSRQVHDRVRQLRERLARHRQHRERRAGIRSGWRPHRLHRHRRRHLPGADRKLHRRYGQAAVAAALGFRQLRITLRLSHRKRDARCRPALSERRNPARRQ